MIVVMKVDATIEQIDHMAEHITALGLTPQVIHGKHQTVIAALVRNGRGWRRCSNRAKGSRRSCRSWPRTSVPRRS